MRNSRLNPFCDRTKARLPCGKAAPPSRSWRGCAARGREIGDMDIFHGKMRLVEILDSGLERLLRVAASAALPAASRWSPVCSFMGRILAQRSAGPQGSENDR